MTSERKILAIIPARKGSKGLPGKNTMDLLGKPLIGWTIEQAKNCPYINEIHVSTNCNNTAKISEEFGVKVPELRPEHLAQDNSSSIDLVEYIIKCYEQKNQRFDFIILLEPTSPLRKEDDLKKVIELMINNPDKDGVVSFGEVTLEHPLIVKKIDTKGSISPYLKSEITANRRQDLDKAYFPYGVSYLIKESVFRQKKAFYTDNIIPYFIERWQNYEIDDICDFICTEAILKAKISKII